MRLGNSTRVPTERGVAAGEVDHAAKRVGVVGAELGLHELEGLLELRVVVAAVVDQADPRVPGPHPESALHRLLHPVGEQLAVDEGVVRRGGEGREVPLSLWGEDVGAGELPVGDHDAVAPHVLRHPVEGVVAHLVPQPPRPGVEEEDRLPGEKPEGLCCLGEEDLLDLVDLEEVVPRAERAEPYEKYFTHSRGFRAGFR